MKAEITLTTSESKRFLAKAILSMVPVCNALKNGILIVCRGTTNAYVLEELTGARLKKENYAFGYIGPRGLETNSNPANETVFIKGKVKEGVTLTDIAKDLKPGDIIIKGANAIGPDGIPGVLVGRKNPKATAGTIGIFQMTAMARGIDVIIPVGLEKAIPISVLVGSKELSASKVDWATGIPCGLVPIFGTVVTEVEALQILTEVYAIPIAAGGIGGAEGSITLLIKGSEDKVQRAIRIIESIKGEPSIKGPE